MHERPKVVPFPASAERVIDPTIKARIEAKQSGKLVEIYAPLDIAKVVGIRRIIEEERVSLPGRFTPENLRLTNIEVDTLSVPKIIQEVNDATDELVRLDPVRFVALLNRLEEHTEDPANT